MGKEKRFVKILSEGGGTNQIWVDRQTGVNYLYHNGGYGGGICVLVDQDGKPVVTPIPQKDEE